MLRRIILVTALALTSACARGPVRPATVHLDPGMGTLLVTEHGRGGERVCSTECSATYPTRTRLDVELRWPRRGRTESVSQRVSVSGDLSIRGEWNDRSGLRGVGGSIFLLGGGLGAGLVGLGANLFESSARDHSALGGILGVLGSSLVIFAGVAIGAAAIGVGLALLGLRDHAAIRVGPLRGALLVLTPTDGGASLSAAGTF